MPENIEENREEHPTRDDITVGQIWELEQKAEAGDLEAQKRLAEIEGVENYEQYLSLPKMIIEVDTTDTASAGILRAIMEVYNPETEELSGAVSRIGENVITPEVWESLSKTQASLGELIHPRMEELSERTEEALRLASMPWADSLPMQLEDALQLTGAGATEHIQDLLGLTADNSATVFGAEKIAELTELAGQPLDQIHKTIADRLTSAQPMSGLARSLDQSMERIKPSLAGILDSTISGKDLLGQLEAPDFQLDTSFREYVYVSPQERLADEVAESNRLNRELLAEMREERMLKRLSSEETNGPEQQPQPSRQGQVSSTKSGTSSHPRRMHFDTEASLQHLRQIRAEAIANNRPIPKRSVAMSEAGIASRTWKTHDLELWARWEDKSFMPGK